MSSRAEVGGANGATKPAPSVPTPAWLPKGPRALSLSTPAASIPIKLRPCGCVSVPTQGFEGRVMHLLILFIFVALAAIIVWVADWTTVPGRRGPTAVDVLNRRLARGEIDRAEYEEKRRLLGR
jgi:putative membrane protein